MASSPAEVPGPEAAASGPPPAATSSLRARRAAGYEGDRADVQALVPRTARRVLELGCASGALGADLKARQQVEIVGVELDPHYAADA